MRYCFTCCNFHAAFKIRGLSNNASCSFRNLKEQLQRSIKCLIAASDSKGEHGEGLEMYRMIFKQKDPVYLLRMTDEKAQDLQGVIQNSSITCFWQMLILRGSRWLQLQSQLFLKLLTSKTVLWPHCTGQPDLEDQTLGVPAGGLVPRWPWRWPRWCCTARDSSRICRRALLYLDSV